MMVAFGKMQLLLFLSDGFKDLRGVVGQATNWEGLKIKGLWFVD